MSGDAIFMPANAMMMIHNPWTLAQGNADELRKQADDMDRIRESLIEAYLGKAGEKLDRDRLIALLDAETWLTAQECLELGFATASKRLSKWLRSRYEVIRELPEYSGRL